MFIHMSTTLLHYKERYTRSTEQPLQSSTLTIIVSGNRKIMAEQIYNITIFITKGA